ncbi:DNA repair protein rad18 [Patellaria atrata CBS 101060]|uniref:Postreplication repair E3 ubiquitin-protein ligase RAD18 n=1 Tax=Patellaria atrata CBS 101060 TaxID=1346257 RepID=A0A9P4S9V2_9PEZI|nr:DNA repair protein rad18 [Patellaria atrata CBS 101060]
MDRNFELPDPSDWHDTSLSKLERLDNALRCQVCKDFFDTPMITSCSHTFCSLCIRRCFASDGKCPACRASDQDSKLRRNWAVQELVDAFKEARPTTLKLARQAESGQAERSMSRKALKRKLEDTDIEDEHHENIARRSKVRTTRSQTKRANATATSSQEVIDLDTAPESDQDYQPDDGLVACPICNKRMKEEAVFQHLERCDEEMEEEKNGKVQSRSTTKKPSTSLDPQSNQHARPPPARISQLNYSLLNETQLRKKIKESGIPNWGPRQLLQRRHIEWVNLWNSNCDSSKPRSKRELLQELDTWERSQGGNAPGGFNPSGTVSTSSVMRKDFDGAGWAKNNQNQFSQLIAEARKKRNKPPSEEEKKDVRHSNINGDVTSRTPDNSHSLQPSLFESSQLSPSLVPADKSFSDSSIDPARPYENNGVALASIRSKVTNINDQSSQSRDPPHSELPSSSQRSRGKSPTVLPKELASPPSRKIPMFRVPEEPLKDLDGAGTGTSESSLMG